MAFTLKSYLPRSVYGRAALILILPVVFVQVVVSGICIQRHFDGVTRQLSRGAGIEVGLLVSQIDSAADLPQAQARAAALAAGLRVDVTLPATHAPPSTDLRAFWDLSGREVGAILHDALPQVVAVDLAADPRNVQLWVQTRFGAMRVDMSRLRVSASNPHQLLVIMALASILMTAVAFVFLRNQLVPITRMAAAAEGPDASGRARQQFATLRSLRDRLAMELPAAKGLEELSMGMSDDFADAILEGATLVRIGSALWEGVA